MTWVLLTLAAIGIIGGLVSPIRPPTFEEPTEDIEVTYGKPKR